MSLAAGWRLGPYEVIGQIGAGGMGEVWRAADTRLKRQVALKALSSTFISDPDRVARFAREAEVLAALNHPNVAQIYGVEEANGITALVMELVEGPTLADRIALGPVPVDEALPIACQIAEALEAAHENGIIHRDLKPANVKVRADGMVKVLDFGLAKAFDPVGSTTSHEVTNSPTVSLAATQAGVLLGTAAYMSPEQAAGKAVDRRADVWSFGVTLWEMLTGRRLFDGESTAHTLADVLRGSIDLDALPPKTPPAVRQLIGRCLDRNPRTRLRDIGEARIALNAPPSFPQLSATRGTSRSWIGWAVAAVLVVLVVALGVFAWFSPRPVAQAGPPLRFTIATPANASVHSVSVSPDGRSVAIAAAAGGKQQLWLQRLDRLQAQPLATTEDATYPFWSPDSRYIAFFARGKLMKIAAGGGAAQALCDAAGARGGAWNREDVIVFSQSGNSASGLQRVAASGGIPVDAVSAKGVYRYPAFLPDDDHFLFTDIRPGDTAGIYLASLKTGDSRRILSDRSSAVFAEAASDSRQGHVLFVRDNNLLALPFDARTAQAHGDTFIVAEGVSLALANSGYAPFTVSRTGVLLYWSGDAAGGANQIVWYDRAGNPLGSPLASGNVFTPAISLDERFVAFTRPTNGGNYDLWLRDLVRATDIRLTGGGRNFAPAWSFDSKRIVLTTGGAAFGSLSEIAITGSSGARALMPSATDTGVPFRDRSEQWTRDGRFVVFSRIDSQTNLDLWLLPMTNRAEERTPVPFLQTNFNESQGQLSPDGRWMAYTSDESDLREVYISSFPTAESKWKVSTAGGEQPRWRGDGKELFYVAASGELNAVAVRSTETLPNLGIPVSLFNPHLASATNIGNLFQYDVSRDGDRFVAASKGDSTAAPPLNVVVNWTSEVK